MKRFSLLAVLLFAVSPTFADSINIMVIDLTPHGQFNIQLNANSNPLIPDYGSRGELLWGATFLPAADGTYDFSLALSLAGNIVDTFESSDQCPLPQPAFCGEFVKFDPLPFFPNPVDGTLKVSVNGVSEKGNFRFVSVSPVPEPTSILLLGTGLAGIGWRRYRGIMKATS